MVFDTTPVENAIRQLSRGGVIIVVDDAERENEGDFLAAAELVTPAVIHFMISHGRGHLCQSISSSTASRLQLQPLVTGAGMDLPRFAMPLDAREGGSGISPTDRARTIRKIADPTSAVHDFVRPGHITPLIAQDGGVLRRPGHTEAAVDLTRLAGLAPSGVLCEICSRDGRNMAQLPELEQLAAEFSLPLVSIEQLIAYRRQVGEELELLESITTVPRMPSV